MELYWKKQKGNLEGHLNPGSLLSPPSDKLKLKTKQNKTEHFYLCFF